MVDVVTDEGVSVLGFVASWTSLTTRLCIRDSGFEKKGAV